ncbi:MAG: gfo/Idh/MocA family oxidoreductase, partial [Flavobacterium sp.]
MKRRNFIQSSSVLLASTGLGSIIPLDLFASKNVADKIRFAVIGVTGMGWSNLNALLKDSRAQCVALC